MAVRERSLLLLCETRIPEQHKVFVRTAAKLIQNASQGITVDWENFFTSVEEARRKWVESDDYPDVPIVLPALLRVAKAMAAGQRTDQAVLQASVAFVLADRLRAN